MGVLKKIGSTGRAACLCLGLAFASCGAPLFAGVLVAFQIPGALQFPGNGTSTAPASSTVVARTISGRVINALTGNPVPRALVNLNSRAVLTDARGAFQFANFTEAQAYASVSKPGYWPSADASDGNQTRKIADLDAALELKLYPDALLIGTVTGSEGLPLSRVQVRLIRLSYEATGPRWNNVGFSQTNARGEFRFSQPGGRYRIETNYTPRDQEIGQAILPVRFPENGGDAALNFVSVTSGEQRQVDLRPRIGPVYPVVVRIQNAEEVRNVRLSVVMGSGLSFAVPNQSGSGGELRVNLPVGSYTLRAVVQDRDDAMEGSARLTVTAQGTHEVTLQLAPAATFPVEVTAEPAVASTSTATTQTPAFSAPNGRALNLILLNRANQGDGENQDVNAAAREDGSSVFRVRPGRYTLAGNAFGAWFVKTAACGLTNLLEEDLVVGPSSAGSPIRVTLSNATGRVHGTALANGLPLAGWLYLLPEEPSIVPFREIAIQADGTFTWQGPEGRYTLVAVDRRLHGNFRDSEFRKNIAILGQPVQVTFGADIAVTAALSTLPQGMP